MSASWGNCLTCNVLQRSVEIVEAEDGWLEIKTTYHCQAASPEAFKSRLHASASRRAFKCNFYHEGEPG